MGNPRRHLPACMGAARGRPVYRFAVSPSAAAVARLANESEELAAGELARNAGEYEPVVPGLQADDVAKWYSVSPGNDVRLGEEIPPQEIEEHGVVLGTSALYQPPGASCSTLEKLHPDSVHERIEEIRLQWIASTPRGAPGVPPPASVAGGGRQYVPALGDGPPAGSG
jgi:hypothetical protein